MPGAGEEAVMLWQALETSCLTSLLVGPVPCASGSWQTAEMLAAQCSKALRIV